LREKGRIICNNTSEAIEKLPPKILDSWKMIFGDLQKEEAVSFLRDLLGTLENNGSGVTLEEIEQLREEKRGLNLYEFCKCTSCSQRRSKKERSI